MMNKFIINVVYWLSLLALGSMILALPAIVVWKLIAFGPLMQLSDGTMRATSAKLSYKGIVWKTTDGWIPIGVNSEGGLKRWKFTVKNNDQRVIDCINNNEKVKLHYKDYILMPYRLGYGHQVDSCEIIKLKELK